MATTMIGPADNLPGLDHYIGNIASKDHDSPEPTERAEYCSTIGDCTPENFVDRVRENAAQHGKSGLKHEAYHVIISQTHEEADPHDPQAGHRQHVMTVALVKNKFPGHMAKLITQRDNGKWIETPDDERAWEPGKWHTHAIIANVSSREAVLELTDGTKRRYKAGRAIDGAMKDVNAIRHGPGGTDALILEHFGYDNPRYVEECRKAAKGRGDRATTRDMADRADHGYSSHDEVRVRLREARALATSWDDYVARLEARAVMTRVTGKSGVSYAWVGADGIEHAASARSRKGRDGLGGDFTMKAVAEQCAANAERVANGESLEAPERAMVPVPPTPTDRPVPVYLTSDGRPPWERDLDDYAQRVRESGGTYESVARERIDLALEDGWITDRDRLIVAAPDHGIEVSGRTDEPLIALDASDGRIVFEAGHLGDDYTGDRLDRRIKSRGKDRTDDHDDRGARSAPGRATGGRSAAGPRIEQVRSAGVAALSAANLRRAADRRAELDDRGSQHIGHSVGDTEGRRLDEPADRAGREGGQRGQLGRGAGGQGNRGRGQAGSDTPIRDLAVQRESERAGDGGDRGRG